MNKVKVKVLEALNVLDSVNGLALSTSLRAEP